MLTKLWNSYLYLAQDDPLAHEIDAIRGLNVYNTELYLQTEEVHFAACYCLVISLEDFVCVYKAWVNLRKTLFMITHFIEIIVAKYQFASISAEA